MLWVARHKIARLQESAGSQPCASMRPCSQAPGLRSVLMTATGSAATHGSCCQSPALLQFVAVICCAAASSSTILPSTHWTGGLRRNGKMKHTMRLYPCLRCLASNLPTGIPNAQASRPDASWWGAPGRLGRGASDKISLVLPLGPSIQRRRPPLSGRFMPQRAI